jgi:hypothetical protein
MQSVEKSTVVTCDKHPTRISENKISALIILTPEYGSLAVDHNNDSPIASTCEATDPVFPSLNLGILIGRFVEDASLVRLNWILRSNKGSTESLDIVYVVGDKRREAANVFS